jgi:hypothetical protein
MKYDSAPCVYICMYICMCVRRMCFRIVEHRILQHHCNMCVHVHVCIRYETASCVYICMYIRVCVCVRARADAFPDGRASRSPTSLQHVCVCMCVYVHVCMKYDTALCVYACVYLYMGVSSTKLMNT